MPGLVMALWDALRALVVVVLLASVVGWLWRGALLLYPTLVVLAHDGRTYLALAVTLVLLVALLPGGYRHGA